MFGQLRGGGPCKEAESIVEYVECSMQGKCADKPSVSYPLHNRVLESFQKLLDNEEYLYVSAKKLLEIVSSISSFDVEMTHISYQLAKFADEMASLSQSNLAIVEETTASMNRSTSR